MADVVVLGAGLVGAVIAADLAGDADLSVTVADRDPAALERAAARVRQLHPGRTVRSEVCDLSDRAVITALATNADVVCGALPSRFGLQALDAIIETGTPYSDITFMPEDAIDLDAKAVASNAKAIVDCGVAPGMSNFFAGVGVARLDRTDSINILVGGLPRERSAPFEYKAGFAPSDVIEEYLRPARQVEDGKLVVYEALSGIEEITIPGVGTMEYFHTDGLRSLAETLDVPNMTEKTMRWPGHAKLMKAFRATGFFDEDPIEINGAMVRPIDVTHKLLLPKWEFGPGEADMTVMRVTVAGERGGESVTLQWDLIDHADAETGTSSMSRTTGFPCATFARMLLAGEIEQVGVLPPERIGLKHPSMLDRMLAALAERGVTYHYSEIVTA